MKNIIKKLSKSLLSLLVIAAVFVMSLPTVSASEAPKNITVKRTALMQSFIGDNNDWAALSTANGIIVYCIELEKTAAATGTSYTYSKDADAGMLWLIKNGYPNKSITGSKERDQFITQGAIWWYLDDMNGTNKLAKAFKTTDKEAYAGDRSQIIRLVNNAKAHSKDVQTNPTLTLNGGNTKLKLTADKKYYESEYMSANVTGVSTYDVTATGAKNINIYNENGAIQTKFNSGEKFKIKALASDINSQTTINVKAVATKGIETVAIYNPSDSMFQKVVSTKITTKNVTAEKAMTLSVTPSKPVCKFENDKYYGKNGNVVDKETFDKECGEPKKVCVVDNDKYYGKNGNVVDKKTFDKECGEPKKVCVVDNDKYYGKDGKEVDEDTYNKECNSVVISVPNTLSNVSVAAIIFGVILVTSGAGLIAYRKKLNK